jgi:large subunit ribosomal protein L53
MITRFITEVNTKINPFSAQSKSARLFLTTLPPAARSQGMIIQTKLLPRAAAEKNSLQVKFSKETTLACPGSVLRLSRREEVERERYSG